MLPAHPRLAPLTLRGVAAPRAAPPLHRGRATRGALAVRVQAALSREDDEIKEQSRTVRRTVRRTQ